MGSKEQVIERSPDIMGGTAVFAGTRVPVQTLIDYLEAGDRLDDFLEDFPTVGREQAVAFLELAKDAVLRSMSSSRSIATSLSSRSCVPCGWPSSSSLLAAIVWPDLLPMMPAVAEVLPGLSRGQVIRIGE